MILEIGPAANAALGDVLKNGRTLVWNGPLGAFETPPFDAATVALARTAAALTREGQLVSVAGGGDTVAALNQAGVADDFSRSEEHTSELQSLMRISYAVFCLKKKTHNTHNNTTEL